MEASRPARAALLGLLVVLSEPLSPPHREALEDLRDEWRGEAIELAPADGPLPRGPHQVVVAFGGRAAARAGRAGSPTVAALAPAARAGSSTVVVAMTPSPERVVELLSAAGVRRVLAIRSARAEPDFVRRAAAAGKRSGVIVEDAILDWPGQLPRALRGAGARADGIWLVPDPGSVTQESFAVAREYARGRRIPFFAPTAGLVSEEIRGDLAVSYGACGREAARAARELSAGRAVDRVVYPSP